MRTAMGAARLLGVAAVLVVAAARPADALVVQASVSPGISVPVGTVITITATLTSESWLGNLEALPSIQSKGCSYPAALEGWYAIYPDSPMLVSQGVPNAPSVNFTYTPGTQRWVQWKFTASHTGTVVFSVVAANVYFGVFEGCSDPSPLAGGLPVCGFGGLPYGTNVCGFAAVTITATLTGRLNAQSGEPNARPPATVFVGDSIEVVMSVTNTGAAPIAINGAVSSTAGTGTDVLLVAGAAPSFPVPLAGAASAMLTWAYSVTPGSPPGTAAFWTDAEGTLAYSDPLAVIPPPQLTLSVTLFIDPDGGGPDLEAPADHSYFMADDEVWVMAKLENASAWDYDVDPVIAPADNDYSGKPDFRLVGTRIPAGAQTLLAGTAREFTWKYVIDRSDYYQDFCFPPVDMWWKVSSRGLDLTAYLPVFKEAVRITPDIPSVVEIGSGFSATLWVTNRAARPMVLDASATVFLTTMGGPLATIVAGPAPGSRSFTAGQSLPFVFTCTADSTGSQMWWGGAKWAAAAPCLAVDPIVATEIVAPSPLVPTFLSSTNVVNAQTPYGLTLSLYNSSACPVTLSSIDEPWGINERPIPYAVFSNWDSTDCPALPCVIASGATAVFRWSVTPNGCGDEDWSGTMTGDWDPGCLFPTAFSRPYNSNRLRVRQQASLYDPGSVGWILPQATVVETQTFQVVCRVTPGGENNIENFTLACMPHFSSTSTVISQVAPIPSIPGILPGCGTCVTNVCPDKTRSFTWTYSVTAKGASPGQVWFTFTATGQDAYDGTPQHSMTSTGKVRILRPSTISVSAMNDPGFLAYCNGSVAMDIEVNGDTCVVINAVGITPSGPEVVVESATNFSNGQEFDWTYTPVGVGCVSFTVSAVGVECGLGLPVFGVATTADSRCFTAPAPSGALAAYRLIPGMQPVSGTPFEVRLSVTNSGDISVDSLRVLSWTMTGGLSCGGIVARVPALSATSFNFYGETDGRLYGCGKRADYFWWFTTTPGGEGVLRFSVTVTALRSDTGTPVKASANTCITVWPALLASIESAPENVVQGRDFDVAVKLDNQSAVAMTVSPLFPVITSESGEIQESYPGPGAVSVGSFSSKTVVARMNVKAAAAPGPQRLLVSADRFVARETLGKAQIDLPVMAGPPVTVNVLPGAPVFEIGENPWHPLRGPLAIRYVAPDGGSLRIKVYSLAGEFVRTIADEGSAGVQGTVLWDGKNDDGQTVSAGIYLLRFEGRGLKVTKKLAVVK